VNFCGILLIRLEELVKFLNSLLQKKDIGGLLGYELKKAITRAVDRSFDLSRNFTQSNSMISEMSMIDLVDSLASSTIANSMIDSLNSDNFQLKTENDSNKMKSSQVSGKGHKSLRSTRKSLVSMLLKQQSESEEWSEPDRDISKERIGLSVGDESMQLKPHRTSTSDEEEDENDVGSEHKLVRKADWKLIHEKVKSLENLLQEKNDKILEVSGMLLDAENDAKDKIIQIKKKLDEAEKDIQHYKTLYHQVTGDKCELTRSLQEKESTIENMKSEKDKINVDLKVLSSKYESQLDINRDLKNKFQSEEEKLHKLQLEYESKCKTYDQLVTASEKREKAFKDELQQNWIRKTIYTQLLHELEKKQERLKDYQQKFSAMEEEMKMMQNQVVESEDRLEKISRNLDTATLQLSTAAVERSKAMNEKRALEAKIKKINEDYQKLNIEKQEANLKIADLEVFNAKLQNKLLIGGSEKIVIGTHLSDASGYASEDANAMRSASFSSNDEKEFLSLDAYSNCISCKKLANEMNEIRKNLNQSKRSLEQAYSRMRNQNLRKAQIEMDIKQQIVKTQSVLQTVRTNMEIELNRGVPVGLKKES
jgi:centrosomin